MMRVEGGHGGLWRGFVASQRAGKLRERHRGCSNTVLSEEAPCGPLDGALRKPHSPFGYNKMAAPSL